MSSNSESDTTTLISQTQKFMGRYNAEPMNMSDNAIKGFVIFSIIFIGAVLITRSFTSGNPMVNNIITILITLYVFALSIWYLIYAVNRYA